MDAELYNSDMVPDVNLWPKNAGVNKSLHTRTACVQITALHPTHVVSG